MITDRIQQLVALAMKDAVLTYRERLTIVQEAIKDGIPEQEINQHLDGVIAGALQNAAKENLKRCPKCGGQIPLISNQCLYCGHEFGNDNINVDASESQEAARIIEQENANTAQQQASITHCPDCGSLLPLLGNICTHCGHVVHEQRDSELNIRNLINDINKSIVELNAYKVKKEDVSADMKPVFVFGGLVILMIVLAYIHENLFQYAISASIFYALIYLRKIWTAKDKSVDAADRKFFHHLFQYEKYSSHVETLYGNHPEGRKALADFQKAMEESQARRQKVINANRKRNITILAIFMAIIVALGALHGMLDIQYDLEANLRNANTHQPQQNFLDGALQERNMNMSQLLNKTVVLRYGKSYDDGSIKSDYIIPSNMFEYIKPLPDATLTVSFHNDEGKDALTADTYWIGLRLDNVYMESTGKAWPVEGDTLVAFARICGKGANYLGNNIMISNVWTQNSKVYSLPDDHMLWYIGMLAEGRGAEYVTFVNNYQLEYSSLQEVIEFMDNVDSYYLELKSLAELRKEEGENGN
ncbi:MAG: hypothetical protein MJZ66_06720 [Bacteroidales bacterium]|nr:hypothetical protein [Bacteroidales bacterium]